MTRIKYFSSITLLIILLNLLEVIVSGVPNRKIEDSPNIQRHLPSICNNNNLNISSNSIISKHKSNLSSTPKIKNWHVSKVSRKQYELINMLWRKTKIFVDEESNTVKYQARRENLTRKAVNTFRHLNSFQVSLPRSFMYSSTPSYFEFYYIHEIDDRINRKDGDNMLIDKHSKVKGELQNDYDNLEFVPKTPIFAFHVFDQYYKRPQVTPHQFTRSKKMYSPKHANYFSSNNYNPLSNTTSIFPYKDTKTKATLLPLLENSRKSLRNTEIENNVSNNSEYLIDNETCLYLKNLFDPSNYSNTEKSNSGMAKNVYHVKLTTLYDKIKFFETYDKHTRIMPQLGDEKLPVNSLVTSKISQRKIILENVDHGFPQNTQTIKHIIERRNELNEKCSQKRLNKLIKTTTMVFNCKTNNVINNTETSQKRVKLESTAPKMDFNNVNKSALWSQYPFAAVYIYEPLQVHCDAAAISPHWLIAAGSCLFGHHKNPGGEGLSAFVAYCGESWWRPERVAYVKYSVVHPSYHSRDKTRRNLYNIGVIQVASSMASACNGWSAISLMSHHFTSSHDISKASAIGWGLDRFDTKYSSMELPKWPLMAYEAPVYSDSCPGNKEYSKLQHDGDETGVNNVYCLLLPPYSGEESDPVHGSLLLIGEKLIALYLQEERRPWGEQSAQYTGTWRLVPWVLDVAREPDEADTFTIDI